MKTARAHHRARRNWVIRAGVALVIAGVIVLGFAGWQYVGTTALAHHRHSVAISVVERAWAHGGPTPTSDAAVRTEWGKVEAILRIPRFGADYAMPIYAGTTTSVLSAGVGHFAGTARAGDIGNYALAAHRITHGEPFRRLPELRVGDRVIVETRTQVFTYRLTTPGTGLTVSNSATWVLDDVPHNPRKGGVEPAQTPAQRLITLTTCSELFHTDDRSIVFGVLESAVRAPGRS